MSPFLAILQLIRDFLLGEGTGRVDNNNEVILNFG
jgi:hypothetical protein